MITTDLYSSLMIPTGPDSSPNPLHEVAVIDPLPAWLTAGDVSEGLQYLGGDSTAGSEESLTVGQHSLRLLSPVLGLLTGLH